MKNGFRLMFVSILLLGLFLSPANVKTAQAIDITTEWVIQAYYYGYEWDGNTSYDHALSVPPLKMNRWVMKFSLPLSELRKIAESELGYPVTILAFVDDGFCGPRGSYLSTTSDSDLFSDYPACKGESWAWFMVYKAPQPEQVVRLTLFSYYLRDTKNTCTLYSLDGSKNLRPDMQCGGPTELVCTTKLIGSELIPECTAGYEQIGYHVSTDPNWLAWAEKFASVHGRK